MAHHDVISSIIISFLILHTVAPQQQEELCSNPVITYRPTDYRYRPEVQATLSCDLGTNTIKWWMSSDPCGSFNESTLCTETANTCHFNITDIEDRFYHCCTSGGEVENNLNTTICFHIRICTFLQREDNAAPPIGFYGETLLIYETLYAHPPPNQIPSVHLGSTNITGTQLTVVLPDRRLPELIYEYRIPIPSDMGTGLDFFGNFKFDSVCSENHTVNRDVKIRTRPNSVTTSTSMFTTPSSTDGLQVCEVIRTGLFVGLFVTILISAGSVLLTIVLSCVCVHKRKAAYSSELRRPDAVPPRSDLSVRYNPLSPMYPSSSSTIGLHQRNGIVNTSPPPPPHSNDSTPNQPSPSYPPSTLAISLPTATTPVTPTNLQIAQGVTPSHTGETPLIAFTPGDPNRTFLPGDPGRTFPPVSQSSNNYYDEINTSANPIAMTIVSGGGEVRGGVVTEMGNGGNGGNGGFDNHNTVYSEPIIVSLASNVQLSNNNNSASIFH